MIRILHLAPTSPDFQTRRAIEQLHSAPGADQSSQVHRVGPLAAVPAAVLRLRRDIRGADVVHAWSIPGLLVASFCGARALLLTPPAMVTRSAARWIRAVQAHRSVDLLCPSATLRQQWLEAGIAPQHCHLLRPGVDFARLNRRRDPQLRAALGLGDDDFVLLAAGESTGGTRGTDHRLALWTAALLNVQNARYRLLLWGAGPHTPAMARLAQRVYNPQLTIFAQQRLGKSVEFEAILPAADLILATAQSSEAQLPIAIAMAAGLPLVGAATAPVAELLEDRHNALLAPAIARRLARRVLDLREDAALQWTLANTARAEAYEFHSLTRFRQQHRTIYQQSAAGKSLELPDQATPAQPGHG